METSCINYRTWTGAAVRLQPPLRQERQRERETSKRNPDTSLLPLFSLSPPPPPPWCMTLPLPRLDLLPISPLGGRSANLNRGRLGHPRWPARYQLFGPSNVAGPTASSSSVLFVGFSLCLSLTHLPLKSTPKQGQHLRASLRVRAPLHSRCSAAMHLSSPKRSTPDPRT